MYKKLSLILASIITVASIPICAHGFNNPLKSYNLYEDTHREASEASQERETVMGEYYSNSLRAPGNNGSGEHNPPSSTPDFSDKINNYVPKEVNATGRNQTLRNSSRNVYSNLSEPASWEIGPYFYPNPTLESIKQKYKNSNFAGCMQEAESYVKLNPNDTLGFYYLAMSYAKTDQKEKAIRAYERVITLNDNPMIVKYATNGRNCVLGSDKEQCYMNVNEPELVYPYAELAKQTQNMKPINPQDLINRNISSLQGKLIEGLNNGENQGEGENKGPVLPFRNQDDELDKFINSPYGNGLSPELNNEYKILQLKKLQQNMNNSENEDLKNNFFNNIRNFDKGSDAGLAKLAYIDPSKLDKLSDNPEYAQAQKELKEMRMLLGNNTSNRNEDFMDILLSGGAENMPPEVIKTMMLQSITTDLIGNN